MDTIQKRVSPVAMRAPGDFTDQLIEPFAQLRSDVDRLFDGFPFRLPALGHIRFASMPAIDMSETEKAYKIMAELPGMEPDDVEVTLEEGMLRIAGEKKQELEENERGYHRSERRYGAFERLVQLPGLANPDKIDAKFRNGVLTLTIAKNGEAKANVKKIRIKS